MRAAEEAVRVYSVDGAELGVRAARLGDGIGLVDPARDRACVQPTSSPVLCDEARALAGATSGMPLYARDACCLVGGERRRLLDVDGKRWFCDDADRPSAAAETPALATLHEVGHLVMRLGKARVPVPQLRVRLDDPAGASFLVVDFETQAVARQPIGRCTLAAEVRDLLLRRGVLAPAASLDVSCGVPLFGEQKFEWFAGHFRRAATAAAVAAAAAEEDEADGERGRYLRTRGATFAWHVQRRAGRRMSPACGRLRDECRIFLARAFDAQRLPGGAYLELARRRIMVATDPAAAAPGGVEPLWRVQHDAGDDPEDTRRPLFRSLAAALRAFDAQPEEERVYTLFLYAARTDALPPASDAPPPGLAGPRDLHFSRDPTPVPVGQAAFRARDVRLRLVVYALFRRL